MGTWFSKTEAQKKQKATRKREQQRREVDDLDLAEQGLTDVRLKELQGKAIKCLQEGQLNVCSTFYYSFTRLTANRI